MDCESVNKVIDKYYEAKLTKQEMTKVSLHLKNCVGCKKDFTDMVYRKDHYSTGKIILKRLVDQFIEFNSQWDA